MKYTPDTQYREDYVESLTAMAKRTFLLAVPIQVNADGSRTRMTLIGTARDGSPQNVTMWAAHALQESVHKRDGQAWGVEANSGGTNPAADLQYRLSRALGVEVNVVESA